MLPDRVNT